jgi:HAD superfamily hydrolase (TIGR01509 family)
MDSPKSVAGIIYDMDGLLLDTEPFYTRVAQSIAARYGKTFDWSVKVQMIGKRATDSAPIFTKTLGLPITPEEYLEARKVMLEALFPEAEPMPGAVRLTEHLHRCGVPQAVATSSDSRYFALKTSRHTSWFRIFQCIVIGDDPGVKNGKPAPDIFLRASERLGVSPGACLVFEDSPVGIEAARNAGMAVIAVPDPDVNRDLFRAADCVLRDLNDFDPAAWGLPAYPDAVIR